MRQADPSLLLLVTLVTLVLGLAVVMRRATSYRIGWFRSWLISPALSTPSSCAADELDNRPYDDDSRDGHDDRDQGIAPEERSGKNCHHHVIGRIGRRGEEGDRQIPNEREP